MRSEDQKIEYNTLKKYFEGRATMEEGILVRELMKSAENIFKREEYLHLLWSELDHDDPGKDKDLDDLLDRIHHQINLSPQKRPGSKDRYKGIRTRTSFSDKLKVLGRIAAIFLLPLMSYIGWEIYHQKMWVRNQAEVVYNEIRCPLGATSQFELPDGTIGRLNNGSTLKYPVRFTGRTREVELHGEAFFDVEHNRGIPFIINTIGLDVKVLGTRVNVYSYPDEDYQEITLESGTVELIKREAGGEVSVAEMKPGQHAVYTFGDVGTEIHSITNRQDLPEKKPGQQAVYRTDDGDLYLKYEKTEPYTGWTDGKLILRNDPMPAVLRRLERWYSVKFNILDDRINEYTFWATFEEENLDQVLRLLSLTGPVGFYKHPRETKTDGTFKTQEIDVMMK